MPWTAVSGDVLHTRHRRSIDAWHRFAPEESQRTVNLPFTPSKGEEPVTKAEQETIIRWDQEERIAHLWTAYEPDARRWAQAGFDVRVCDRDRGGAARAWRAEGPVAAIRWRRVKDGRLVKRQGHRKGRLWGAPADDFVGCDIG